MGLAIIPLFALFGIVLSGPVELLDWTFSAASEPLPAGSSATSVVQLPNPVKFYGKTYSEVVISSNGVVTFNGALADDDQPRQLPFSSPTGSGDAMIALFWSDHGANHEFPNNKVLHGFVSESNLEMHDIFLHFCDNCSKEVETQWALAITWKEVQPASQMGKFLPCAADYIEDFEDCTDSCEVHDGSFEDCKDCPTIEEYNTRCMSYNEQICWHTNHRDIYRCAVNCDPDDDVCFDTCESDYWDTHDFCESNYPSYYCDYGYVFFCQEDCNCYDQSCLEIAKPLFRSCEHGYYNTYELALFGNADVTYALIAYRELNWGLEENSVSSAAVVGLNNGDGHRAVILQKDELLTGTNIRPGPYSFTNPDGHWLYRIDRELITEGQCTPDVYVCEYGDDLAGGSDAEMIQADGDVVSLGRSAKRLTLAANEDESDKCSFRLGAKIQSGELKNIRFDIGLEDLEIVIRMGARGRTTASILEKGQEEEPERDVASNPYTYNKNGIHVSLTSVDGRFILLSDTCPWSLIYRMDKPEKITFSTGTEGPFTGVCYE